MSREEADEIREAFELFDNDKDNELDYHEFKVTLFIARYNPSIFSFRNQVALRALGFDVHKADVQRLMRDYDLQGKNKITAEAFHEIGECLVRFLPRRTLPLPRLASEMMLHRDARDETSTAFRLFDDDESGKISLKKLRRVARELGDQVNDDELKSMIDEFDLDGDGESKYQ